MDPRPDLGWHEAPRHGARPILMRCFAKRRWSSACPPICISTTASPSCGPVHPAALQRCQRPVMAGRVQPPWSPHCLPLLPATKMHRSGFETCMKSLRAFCKDFNSLTELLSPKKKNIFMTQGAIIGLAAAEWPRQLLEQLGTAQHGHRGAREASWKVELGPIPPRATAVRGLAGLPISAGCTVSPCARRLWWGLRCFALPLCAMQNKLWCRRLEIALSQSSRKEMRLGCTVQEVQQIVRITPVKTFV